MTGALSGIGVLVTRPRHQSRELAAAIEAAGGEAVSFPVLRIEPRDPDGIAGDLRALPDADIVIFTSTNGVDHGLAQHAAGTARIAAIGPATRRAIERAGVRVDIAAAGGYDSERLLAEPALQDVAGRRIRIVRGDGGRELLAETLGARGAEVDCLTVYYRKPVRHAKREIERLRARWRAGGIGLVTAMSVESFRHLWTALPEDLREALRRTPLVTPSRRVIQTAGETLPGAPAFLATGPQAADMLRALVAASAAGPHAATVPGTRHEPEI